MTIEERMDALEEKYEKRIASLEHELEKEKAVTEIQNCMGRYAYLHTGGMHTACVDCFAVGDPDLSIEIGPSGVYTGPDAAYRVYERGHNESEKDRRGLLAEHALTTPVIEVADDLQTAKAIWISPGHEAGTDYEDGSFEAGWLWGRYAMDFKRVNGQWKIWHFQMYSTFRCGYYKSWADVPASDLAAEKTVLEDGSVYYNPMFPNNPPDKPTTFFEEYSKDRVPKYWPQPPRPYRTFDGTPSMVGAPPEGLEIINAGCGAEKGS